MYQKCEQQTIILLSKNQKNKAELSKHSDGEKTSTKNRKRTQQSAHTYSGYFAYVMRVYIEILFFTSSKDI